MKISKKQLRRIIKEEKARLISESEADDYMAAKVAATNYLDQPQGEDPQVAAFVTFSESLEDIWNAALAAGVDVNRLGDEVEEFMAVMGYEGKY